MDNRYGYVASNSIKNFKCMRSAALWAGLLGIAQSLTWIALTIVGILAYNCKINVGAELSYGSLMKTIFLDLYFKGNCDPNVYQSYNKEILQSVPTVLSTEDIMIWDCVYLGVAVCWLIASVLLLTHVKKDCIKSTVGVLYTWVFVTLCIALMDLALGIIFGIDYGRFNSEAYKYNLNSINAGAILPNAVQLVAAAVTAVSMMIIALKGFVLWLINVGLLVYLLVLAMFITTDKDNSDTLFMPRKESKDILTTRPPIKAYEEQIITESVYTNEGFVPDNRSMVTVELNEEALSRAARMSTDVSLQDHRFRNVDAFQQYPPPRYNNNNNNINNKPEQARKEAAVSVAVPAGGVAVFPAPDYSPPMTRASQPQRNHRY